MNCGTCIQCELSILVPSISAIASPVLEAFTKATLRHLSTAVNRMLRPAWCLTSTPVIVAGSRCISSEISVLPCSVTHPASSSSTIFLVSWIVICILWHFFIISIFLFNLWRFYYTLQSWRTGPSWWIWMNWITKNLFQFIVLLMRSY